MSTRGWLTALLCIAGCATAPQSQLPDDVLLRYGVSHFEGSASLEVKRDGSASYWTSSGGEERTVRGEVTRTELDALAATLRKHDFCSLTSSRSVGVPDEAKPSVRVRLEGLDCEVTLWDNEWYEDEDARASLAAVEAMGRSLSPSPP